MSDSCERISEGEEYHMGIWSWQLTERTLFLTSHPQSGMERGEARLMKQAQLSRSFSLKEKDKGRTLTLPAASFRRPAVAEVAPHRSAKNEAFKITTYKDIGSEVSRITFHLSQRSSGKKGVPLSDVSDFEP